MLETCRYCHNYAEFINGVQAHEGHCWAKPKAEATPERPQVTCPHCHRQAEVLAQTALRGMACLNCYDELS